MLKIIITDTLFNLWNVLKYVQYIIYTRKRVGVNNMRDENIDHN